MRKITANDIRITLIRLIIWLIVIANTKSAFIFILVMVYGIAENFFGYEKGQDDE